MVAKSLTYRSVRSNRDGGHYAAYRGAKYWSKKLIERL